MGEELERLARLQASGDLTNDEFRALKARLLKGLLPEETASPIVEEPPAIGNEPGPDPVGETPARGPGVEEPPAIADNESEPVARPAVEAESLLGGRRSRARSKYNDNPFTVLRRQRDIVTEQDTVRKPKKISRFVITFLVLGVAVTGGVLLLQDRSGEGGRPGMSPDYNPYCEAADGCYENDNSRPAKDTGRTTSTQQTRRTTTTVRHVTQSSCHFQIDDWTRMSFWSDGTTTYEMHLPFCY